MNTPNTHLSNDSFQGQGNGLCLEEVSRVCAVQVRFITELVEEGVLEPVGGVAASQWQFSNEQVSRVKVASRLQRDLGVNVPGAALALQLLKEIETLRAQIATGAQEDI